jgi:hypothetical protein
MPMMSSVAIMPDRCDPGKKGSQTMYQNNCATAIDTDNGRHKDLLRLLQFSHFIPGLAILNATNG